jgi:hypothetical protein
VARVQTFRFTRGKLLARMGTNAHCVDATVGEKWNHR